MRGKRKLFNSLGQIKFPSNKGRSQSLIEKRNNLMIYRYYFFTAFTEFKFESILERLSDEFFISPITISGILTDSFDQFQKVKEEGLTIQQLEKKFPKIRWGIPATVKLQKRL